jgi:serine/threonine-protein kinase
MLRLTTFGTLSIARGDESLGPAAAQRRRLALLALLAVAGERGLPRDKILAFLWPETGEERARHSLTQSLYALRRDLREEELFLGTADLKLNAAVISSDAGDFAEAIARREHERAVALHVGPFLDGCFLSDAPEFERWAEEQRTDFRHQVASALETLAAAATAAGDHRAAAEWWRRLASLDPLNGRVAVGLMSALAAAGNSAGALQHARIHETLVRSELDSSPDAAVLRLAEQLRAAPVVTASAVATPSVPAPAVAAPVATAGPPATPSAARPSSGTSRPSAQAEAQGRNLRSAPLRLLTTTSWHAVESVNAARRSLLVRKTIIAVGGSLLFVLLVWALIHYAAAR